MSAFRKSFFFISALLFGKKIIIHFHSFSVQTTIGGKFKLLYKFLFKYSSAIVVLSERWKEDLIRYVPLETDKIVVISNPSSNTFIYNSYNPADKTILYAGTLNSRKGYADLLNAFKLLCVDNSDYSLAFAGNGELSNAKQIVNDLHISDRVKFYGWVAGIEKKDLFLKASIFCLPSYAEGFPMAVIDALSYGIPVITTPVGGLPDILVDNHDVLYFTPGDVESLYLLLKKLINDVPLKEQLSINGFQAACANFQITSISKKVNNLYHHLLES